VALHHRAGRPRLQFRSTESFRARLGFLVELDELAQVGVLLAQADHRF
jgi:hypothetical protein